MHTKSLQRFLRRVTPRTIGAGALCIALSFVLGVQSAGEVQPIALIEAGGLETAGDMDGNGAIDARDVARILEISQGYREPTPAQLRADPNQDGVLTVDDALRLLSRI